MLGIISRERVWKLESWITGAVGAFVAQVLIKGIYRMIRKDKAPSAVFDPANSKFSWPDALVWSGCGRTRPRHRQDAEHSPRRHWLGGRHWYPSTRRHRVDVGPSATWCDQTCRRANSWCTSEEAVSVPGSRSSRLRDAHHGRVGHGVAFGDELIGERADDAADDRRQPEQPQLSETPRFAAECDRIAGPVERAGFTEVLVTGMLTRWIRVRERPMASAAKPFEARLSVVPMMTTGRSR